MWGGGTTVLYKPNVHSVESHPYGDDIYCIIKVILNPPLRKYNSTAYVVIDTNYTDDGVEICYYDADGYMSDYNYSETTHFIGYSGLGKGDWVHRIEVRTGHHWDLLAEIEIK